MQTKSKRIVQKSVTDPDTGKVYIGYDSADCVPFALDVGKIGLHSLDKSKIMLPYSGPLPVEFEGAADPRISMFVSPGDVRVVLFAERDGKKLHASIEATPDEINDVLFRFFYKDVGGNRYHTRFDNGLDRYWLGHYQAEYSLWKQITLEGYAKTVVSHLPTDKQDSLRKWLHLLEHEQTGSATA